MGSAQMSHELAIVKAEGWEHEDYYTILFTYILFYFFSTFIYVEISHFITLKKKESGRKLEFGHNQI